MWTTMGVVLLVEMEMIIRALIIMVAAYLVGSINAAIIVAKLKSNIDIRDHGSGNAGLTNATRTMGKKAGVFVLLGDVLKAAVVMTAVMVIFPGVREYLYIAGIGAILGHNFPVYFKFKGGKGVLVSITVIFFVSPIVAACVLATWAVVLFISQYVSLASIVGSVSLIVYGFIFESGNGQFIAFAVIIAVLCIKMHSTNIVRLINGEENKIGKKKEAAEPLSPAIEDEEE